MLQGDMMHSDFVYYSLDDFSSTDNILPQGCNVVVERPIPFIYQESNRQSDDFIVLVEFSEIEGPAPVFTIPFSAQQMTDVQLNEFVIQLMSTDYQVNQIGEFKLCEDSKLMRTNICKDVSAYLQYFTLLDTQARGFVRPFCLAYVTKDCIKLQKFFMEFVDSFSKVTKILKHANRKWFADEVGKLLNNLQHIKGDYIKWKQTGEVLQSVQQSKETSAFLETEFSTKRISLSQIAQQYTELETILYVVSNTLVDDTCEMVLGSWKRAVERKDNCSLHRLLQSEVISSTLAHFHSNIPRIPRSFRVGEEILPCPFVVLGQWGAVVAAWELMHLHSHYSQDLALLVLWGWSQDVHVQQQVLVHIRSQDKNVQLQGTLRIEEALDSAELQTLLKNPYLKQSRMCQNLCDTSQDACLQDQNPPGIANIAKNSSSIIQAEDAMCNEEKVHEEQIPKLPVWELLSRVQKGRPGFGILKFFRTFSKIAHHVIFSLLLGRVLVLCGDFKSQSFVSDIMTALIPFIPSPLGKTEKLLRWHHGIVVSMHIKQYKIIGLCIPERLTVHDMISHKDKNMVSILNVQTRQLFAPAYSGRLLANLANDCQRYYEDDKSFLAYLFGILTEIEARVFTYQNCRVKCSEKLDRGNIGMQSASQKLSLTASDTEVIKHLGSLTCKNSPSIFL